MKQLKTTVFLFMTFFVMGLTAQAQSKLAHVNTQEIIEALPETIAADNQLKKMEETYRKDIQASATEYSKKLELYQNEAESQPREVNERRANELAEAEGRIREAQQTAAQEIQKKRADLFAPIRDKVMAAIQKVAKNLGYDYVMDVQALIVATGKDISPEVKKELGL